MKAAQNSITERLISRKEDNTLRALSLQRVPIDFSSNDYLGLGRSPQLKHAIHVASLNTNANIHGSGGSRLLTGNSVIAESTEVEIAAFHRAAAGLLFNSGYDANIGLLASIAQRGDTIITDALIHASLIDGARLSHAEKLKFQHNDLEDLERKLSKAPGTTFVVIESVYSMDGDIAPLMEITEICEKYGAALIVDEAHATGVLGRKGEGLVNMLGMEDRVFARVVTFGKGLGCHGAVILGSKELRDFLINFARSFIYTTALPASAILAIKEAYKMLQEPLIQELQMNINLFDTLTGRSDAVSSAIKTVSFSTALQAKNAAAQLQAQGFDVRAIVSPTVAKGQERLRICIHSYNTQQEIRDLVNLINIQKHV